MAFSIGSLDALPGDFFTRENRVVNETTKLLVDLWGLSIHAEGYVATAAAVVIVFLIFRR
jgi:hypothetical protein